MASKETVQLLGGVNADPQIPFRYTVNGRPAFASVTVHLGANEQVMCDAGSLLWCDSQLSVSTGMAGACSACCRGLANEPCCYNTYTGPGNVTLGFDEPGDMLPFAVTADHGWALSSSAFVCGTTNIGISCRCSGCTAACCSGEGPFLSKVTTRDGDMGIFFAGGYGEIVRHELPEGKSLLVDNGLFFAAHQDATIHMTFLGSCCTAVLSGEGLLMRFEGPGVMYTQTRDPRIFHAIQRPPAPEKDGDASALGN